MRVWLLTIFLMLSSMASAKIWVVQDTRGLSAALQQAAAHDSVLIKKGHYVVGNLIVSQPLTIIGQGFPVLDAQYKSEIFTIKASGTMVQGIEFRHVGETSSVDWAGIKVLEATNVLLQHNRFINCYFGIYLSACQKVSVQNNYLQGTPKEEQTTGNGIHAWKCDSLTIQGNTIKGHRDGIYFEFVTNSLIQRNYSTQNIRYGLHFMFSHNDVYRNNTFEANGAGVAVMYTKLVTMQNNRFLNNWGAAAYGILLKDISDSHIEGNQFYKNTVGVYMEGCSRSVFTRNAFSENGIAIRLQANCDDNTLTINNFMGNTFDMATNGLTVQNTVTNNYWDKYDGYDLTRDGHGDVPYRPVSLFSTLIERVPQVMMLVRSFTATLLDRIEKTIPSLTPENLKDDRPRMRPHEFNYKVIT